MKPEIKIMIVDDHEIYRRGLKMSLRKHSNLVVVDEASHGLEFLEKISKSDTDIILMDVQMPNMNGIEATKAAIEKYPELKIIGLTLFNELDYMISMLEAGAKSLVLKNSGRDELKKTIEAVMEGKFYFHKQMLD